LVQFFPLDILVQFFPLDVLVQFFPLDVFVQFPTRRFRPISHSTFSSRVLYTLRVLLTVRFLNGPPARARERKRTPNDTMRLIGRWRAEGSRGYLSQRCSNPPLHGKNTENGLRQLGLRLRIHA
jgi:hypothetical protein